MAHIQADAIALNQVGKEQGLRVLVAHEEAEESRPWFLYLHYMYPHGPYPPVSTSELLGLAFDLLTDRRPVPDDARGLIGAQLLRPSGLRWDAAGVPIRLSVMEYLYDRGVARFDAALGPLLEALALREDADEIAIVVTSDHGEALFDRGWGNHGYGLHEDEIGIPLAARLPGTVGDAATDCPVGLVDLRATLCDYLSVSCPGATAGTSLFEPVAQPRIVVTEGAVWKPENRAVRDARYKLLYQPTGFPGAPRREAPWSLYDLHGDPGEARNQLARGPGDPQTRARFERLRARLEDAKSQSPRHPTETRAIDDETRERLEALGYGHAD